MMGVSYRGARGGVANSIMEAKPRIVHMLIFQRVSMPGSGVIIFVHMHITTYVKEVSK